MLSFAFGMPSSNSDFAAAREPEVGPEAFSLRARCSERSPARRGREQNGALQVFVERMEAHVPVEFIPMRPRVRPRPEVHQPRAPCSRTRPDATRRKGPSDAQHY